MAKTKVVKENTINFDEGYREFTINGDPNRIIRFNPADYSFIGRANEARKKIIDAVNDIGDIKDEEEFAEASKKLNDTIRENLNYMFGADVYDVAFGVQSPLSKTKDGTLVQGFLNAVIPFIVNAISEEQEKSKAKTSKYTERYHK